MVACSCRRWSPLEFGEERRMKVPKHITVLGSPESLVWEVTMSKTRNPGFKRSTEVQSIIFDKTKWGVSEAKKWLKDHGKKSPAVDSTKEYHRFRQAPPGSFSKSSFRTISLGNRSKGIKAVIAVPKAARNPETRHTSFYSRQFFLCCNPSLTVLFLIDGQYAEEIPEHEVTGGGASLADAYRLWSGFEPNIFYSFDLPQYELKKGGDAIRICYQSDKWDGHLTHYYHDFENKPSIWVNRYSDPTIWALKHKSGRKIVSEEGIIG
jgi:hypothetical protein